jgi:hypothetical protein
LIPTLLNREAANHAPKNRDPSAMTPMIQNPEIHGDQWLRLMFAL